MCTIKSFIKVPSHSRWVKGTASALLLHPWKCTGWMFTAQCSMPVCSEQAQVSLSLSFLLQWEGTKHCFWATHGGLQQVSSRTPQSGFPQVPFSREEILGTWWCLWEQKVSIHQIAPIAAKEQWGFGNFLLLKQRQIGQDFNTRKMSRPLSRALVLNQHVGCSARLCVLLETASIAFKHLQTGAIEEKSLSFLSTQKTHRKNA